VGSKKYTARINFDRVGNDTYSDITLKLHAEKHHHYNTSHRNNGRTNATVIIAGDSVKLYCLGNFYT